MATNYSDYKPYSDVQNVLNAKIAWNKATTDEERQKQNQIANEARQRLYDYGYKDIADQISADGADATTTRKILEKYSPSTTMETNNLKSTEVNRENDSLFKKYNQEYEDLKDTNPFTTAEAKAIMGKYSLAGLQGRDNAVASGGASNGGNIDSYASANAMRQQASLINQGQMTVLESHQQKIDNIRGLLSDMGVNIDRVFNQDETSKNNETARLVEEANVTGYTPSAWTIKNDDVYNTYLNSDGTFKKEMENIDIQALINSAKASGDTETANKLAVVRAKKMIGNWDAYGQYANEGDISYMKPQITEQRRQNEQDNATVLESLKTEETINAANNKSAETIADGQNKTNFAISDNANKTSLAIADGENKTKLAISEDEVKNSAFESGLNGGGVVVDESGGLVVSDDGGSGSNELTGIFADWEDNGVVFNTLKVGSIDESKITSANVDEHGKKAIQSAIKAITNGELGVDGVVSNYELADYLIRHSDTHNTNKNQLTKVFAYFGLDKKMLNDVEDAGFWAHEWDMGVKYKK